MPSIKWRSQSEKGGYLVSTNAAGFRSDFEFAKERPPGKFRAVLFGDSQTAGDGIANANRYSDLLMQIVPNLEVFNYGLSGSGPDQHHLTYLDCADVQHDLVIIGMHVENIQRVVNRFTVFRGQSGEEVIYAKPYYTLKHGQLELHHVPVPRTLWNRKTISPEDARHVNTGMPLASLRKVAKKLGMRKLFRKVVKPNPVPGYDSPDSPEWQLLHKILETWIGGSNVPVLLFLIPDWHFVEEACDPRNYQARFRELLQAADCYVHDPLPDLLQYPIEERREFRYENNAHFKREGHRALAISLAPASWQRAPCSPIRPRVLATAVCEPDCFGGAVS